MKKKIVRTISLMMIAAFLVSGSLYAESYCGRPEGGRGNEKGDKFQKLAEELNLTPEQKEKLKAQRIEFKEKNKALRENMRAKNEELRNELKNPTADRASINATIEDIKRLTGEKLNSRVDKILAMKDVLTPEQYAKLQEKMQEKRRKRKNKAKNSHGFGH